MSVRRVREVGLLLVAVLAGTPASGLPEVRFLAPPDGELLPAGTVVGPRGNALGFAGEPLDAAFVLDVSGSMRAPAAGFEPGTTRLAVAVDGLLALADSAPAQTHFALVTFGTGATLARPLGPDRAGLAAAASAATAGGQTDLAAGLALSLDELRGPRARPAASRLEIVLSDGRPDTAEGLEERVRAAALEAGIATHTVAIPDADTRLLGALAEAGGGVATVVSDLRDLSRILSGGGLLGLERLEVELPDGGSVVLATDAFGGFSVPPTVLLPGPNRFVARARFADGSAATAVLTLEGTPEPTPLAGCLLGLAALARRGGRRRLHRGGGRP